MISEGLLPQGKDVLALCGRESPEDTKVNERKKMFEDTEKNFAVLFAMRRQQNAAGQKENPLQQHPIQCRNVFINFVD